MKIQDLSYLLLRVLAIVLFLMGIHYIVNAYQVTIPSLVKSINSIELENMYAGLILVYGIPSFILFILASFLWFRAEKFVHLFIAKGSDQQNVNVKIISFEAFILSIIGLFLTLPAIAIIIRIIYVYLIMLTPDEQSSVINMYSPVLTEQIFRLVIGLLLIFKADGFAMLLKKIRRLGNTRKRPNNKDQDHEVTMRMRKE